MEFRHEKGKNGKKHYDTDVLDSTIQAFRLGTNLHPVWTLKESEFVLDFKRKTLIS